MPIAINGSGTVTGVSVGGLPDGIVDTDMLAASAVTDAKTSLTGIVKAWLPSTSKQEDPVDMIMMCVACLPLFSHLLFFYLHV